MQVRKVGLVTYYGDNYGACLQAYALSHAIEKCGFDCDIIRFCAKPENDCVEPGTVVKIASKIKRILTVKNPLHRYLLGKKVRVSNRVRCEMFDKFRSAYLKMDNVYYGSEQEIYENPPDYSIFVCGSDQIWNPSFYGRCHPVFFLDFCKINQKRIAYAPSVGISKLTREYESQFEGYLSKFDAISVRENNTVEMLQKLTDKPVLNVLDPTLLLHDEYLNLESDVSNLPSKYIFCYLFGEEEYVLNVKRKISNETGLPVVSIPFVEREYFSDDILVDNAGPAEFVALIRNASLVLTDSFHATAFSVNFNTPFIALLRQSMKVQNEMSSRLRSILSQLGLSQRLIFAEEELQENVLEMDFSEANRLLKEKRKMSWDFLKNSLEEANDSIM